MKKLELHLLTTDEAEELIPLLKDEVAKTSDKKYLDILSGLLDILSMYLAGKVNLYESEYKGL
jgi:hypothetical protein